MARDPVIISTTPVPTLAELVEQPERVGDLSSDAATAFLVQLAPLQTALLARALARTGAAATGRDRLLTVRETAAKMGQSEEWVYKHRDDLPVVRNGRLLRFSEAGIEARIHRQQRR